MLAATYQYPILDFFLTMLYFFLFIIWIWLLITVFIDIFRSHDMGGWAKALWVIFIIILPFLGVFVYLIARGGKMHERAARRRRSSRRRSTPTSSRRPGPRSGERAADQLSKLADLKSQGVITDAEFEAEKAKVLPPAELGDSSDRSTAPE